MYALNNKVSLIGRMGVKPEIKEVNGGYKLVHFSVATHERFRNKSGEWQNNTQWHQVTAWGKIAERVCKFADKGTEIVLEGKLINRQFETKEGEKRFVSEVEMNDFMVLSAKQ